jgi:pSer/pThr/pTyr-binding forkhead associated (FHA) protein
MRSGPFPGKVYPIDGPEISIGRDTSNFISINDAEVSRKHARMELRGSSYVIQDLGSTNGTFINGNRISSMQVINPNDIVSFGESIVLIYGTVSDPNATMLSSVKPPRTELSLEKPAPAPVPVIQKPVLAIPSSPAPVYSGQVPSGPAPVEVPAPSRKSGLKIILIIIAVVVLCIILACIALLLWIDADKTGSRWCQYLPFVARLFQAVCP